MPRSRRTSKLFPALAGAGVLAALSLVAITQGDEAAATGSGHAGSGRHGARVVSPLPAWVVPGGRIEVAGWAGAGERVTVKLGRRTIGRATSGRRGHFRVEATAPAPGRYRIAVDANGRRLRAGRLRVRPLRLAAVGDVTFGSRVADVVRERGPRYPWLSVAPLLRSADLATANLEGAVSSRGAPVAGKEYTFRGSRAALVAAARFAGLDVVSVANNHTLDFGLTAFFDTLRAARRLDVATVGGGADLRRARRPALLRVGGLRLAFLGYSDVRPLGFTAGPSVPGTAPAYPQFITDDVRRARRQADVVVVWFHWGVERALRPNGRQEELAAAALNAGAAVVLAAHPHVLQPIARPDRRRLVAWSLGNFVFPAHSPLTERTGILILRLDTRGVRGHSFRPAYIHGVQPRLG